MTILILQIMRIGIYSSVDDNLNKAVDSVDSYIYMNMYRASLYSAFGGKNNSDLSVLTDGDEFLGNGTTLPGNANSTVNQSPNKSH